MNHQKINLWVRIGFLLLLGIWILFSFIPMIFPNDGIIQLSAKYFYGETCHQIPERSFSIDHKFILVCSRCLGIYFGTFFGLIIFSFLRFKKIFEAFNFKKLAAVHILFALPLIADIFASKVLVINSGNLIRFITGFIVMVPICYFINSGLISLSEEISYKIKYAK